MGVEMLRSALVAATATSDFAGKFSVISCGKCNSYGKRFATKFDNTLDFKHIRFNQTLGWKYG